MAAKAVTPACIEVLINIFIATILFAGGDFTSTDCAVHRQLFASARFGSGHFLARSFVPTVAHSIGNPVEAH